ncbi:hypothetical protein SLA2020_001630 [Shorea laevis]
MSSTVDQKGQVFDSSPPTSSGVRRDKQWTAGFSCLLWPSEMWGPSCPGVRTDGYVKWTDRWRILLKMGAWVR